MDFSVIQKEIEQALNSAFAGFSFLRILYVVGILLAASLGFKLLQLALLRMLKGHISDQTRMLLKKLITYLGFITVSVILADALGLNVSTILGVAGIAGIAIGFAAQTSIANVISGFFLISEKPFAIGDVITTNEVTGIVLSIDMLSVKIKTFDNTFVRIPNESIIKSKVINVTRYPIRRLDLTLSVSYGDELEKVLRVLQELAAANQFCLGNPEPFLMVKQFAPSGIELLMGIWFEKTEYVDLKNSLMIEIQKRFALEHITIPYPQVDVHNS